MNNSIKFVQLGFGPIGQRILKYALERKNLSLESVVDIDPEKVGKDAGIVAGIGEIGTVITNNLESALNGSADIVIVSTSSSMKKIEQQIALCVRSSKNVVSTSEELLYPWLNNPKIAERLDNLSKKYNVSILGTGVNPGLLMDSLPLALSAACRRVDSISIKRYQDASKRRLPFQKKIGAGLDLSRFNELKDKKIIRHVGFSESIQLIAAGIGWNIDKITEVVEPVIADKRVKSNYIIVEKGYAMGVHQIAQGFIGNKAVITLELLAYLGNSDVKDEIKLFGEPDITSVIPNGINGDIATASVIINAIPKVIAAPSGLQTMLNIGAVNCYA